MLARNEILLARDPALPRSMVTNTCGFGGGCAGGRLLPGAGLDTDGIGGGGPVNGFGASCLPEKEDGGELGVL